MIIKFMLLFWCDGRPCSLVCFPVSVVISFSFSRRWKLMLNGNIWHTNMYVHTSWRSTRAHIFVCAPNGNDISVWYPYEYTLQTNAIRHKEHCGSKYVQQKNFRFVQHCTRFPWAWRMLKSLCKTKVFRFGAVCLLPVENVVGKISC